MAAELTCWSSGGGTEPFYVNILKIFYIRSINEKYSDITNQMTLARTIMNLDQVAMLMRDDKYDLTVKYRELSTSYVYL